MIVKRFLIKLVCRLLAATTLAAGLEIAMAGEANTTDSAQSRDVWQGIQALDAQKGYADTPMGQVHYWRSRSSKDNVATIVLVHQTPWFGVQYAKVMPMLAAEGFDAIAIDTPGYGLSDLPDEPPDIEDYADNIVPVLDTLGLSRVIIVGHHTGASIAAGFAQRYPDRTECVVLHGPPLYEQGDRTARITAIQELEMPLAEDGSHLSQRWSRVREVFAPSAKLESVQWSVFGWYLSGPNVWFGERAALAFDMQSAIEGISLPALIISNTGDAIHSSAQRVLDLRPDFSSVLFEGSTPHIFYDDPVPWSSAVMDFVKQSCLN